MTLSGDSLFPSPSPKADLLSVKHIASVSVQSLSGHRPDGESPGEGRPLQKAGFRTPKGSSTVYRWPSFGRPARAATGCTCPNHVFHSENKRKHEKTPGSNL